MAREKIEVIHCPTEKMIEDYFIKPLQGSLFRKMRDIIMGLDPYLMEECIGEKDINTTRNEPRVTRPSTAFDTGDEPGDKLEATGNKLNMTQSYTVIVRTREVTS